MPQKNKKKKKPSGSAFANELKARRKRQSFDFARELDTATRHHKAGNIRQAEQVYRRILSVDPNHVISLYRLGIMAHQVGKVTEGIRFLEKALTLKPDFADAYNSLGILLEEYGDPQAAAVSYRKAISLRPDSPQPYYNLGRIYHKKGSLYTAVDEYRKALALKPDYGEALNNLGEALHKLGDLHGSAASYRKALSLNPNFIVAHNNLGHVYKDQGLVIEAMECFQTALELSPDFAEGHLNIGNLLKEQGRFEEALQEGRHALKIKPDLTQAYFLLSRIQKFENDGDLLAEMEELASRQEIAGEQRMYLSFALGKAYEDTGEYDKAFTYLYEGNMLKRKTYDYSIEKTKHLFEEIKKVSRVLADSISLPAGNPDPTPIFILGMPRSGTSLVEQILASHPEVYGAGELDFFKMIFLQLSGVLNLENAFNRLLNDDGKIISLLGSEYIKEIRGYSLEARHITDKMPHNFMCIGLVLLALPKAKIIHCVRDPVDNCFSIYKNYFTGIHDYAYDMEELGRYYLLYLDLMRYWQELFPGKLYRCSYENMVADQEGETRNLLAYLELPWDDRCLSFYKTARMVSTASGAQVRVPIYRDSVRLWQRYEKQLQPLLAILKECYPENS